MEKNLRQALILIVVIAGCCNLTVSLQDGEIISAVFSFLTVVIPVIVWIIDCRANKKQQQRYEKFEAEVRDYGFEIIDNPEWLKVDVDDKQHILFGIKRDGSIDWSIGVPGPIKKELDEINKRLKILESEKIV